MALSFIDRHDHQNRRAGDDRLSIALVAPVWLAIPPPAYGGIEWIVHWLAAGLTDRGHHVKLAANGESSSPCAERFCVYDESPLGRIGQSLPELLHAVSAYRELGSQDVVHDHTLAGPAIASAAGIEVMHTVHGPMDTDTLALLGQLDEARLVSISRDQRSRGSCLDWYGTVHNAIDVNSFPFRVSKDGYLCTMARMCPDKGIVEAIELARALGMPLRIAAKCAETAERQFFETQVAPLLGGDITYVGELDTTEKKTLLAGASALAFPIQWDEPFGLAVVEALACGTPVLTLSRGAMPELVDHGVTGVVASDMASLVALSRELLPAIWPGDCRAAAERRFHLTRLVDEYEALYYEMAGVEAGTVRSA